MATWFLILASNTIAAVFKSANAWSMRSSSLQIYTLLFSLLFLFIEWKEKQLGNISISLSPRENSVLKGLKEGKTLFNCCLGVNFLSNK